MKREVYVTTSEDSGRRLDDVLVSRLTETLKRRVSKAKARKLIMAGAVSVNSRQIRIASLVLSSQAKIEARIDVAKLFADSTSRDRAFELTAERVLFEDEDLIVVDKPTGLPSHPTADPSRDNLFAAVCRFLGRKVGVHQRLDRDTSGIVLFTKSQRVNAAVGEIFSKHLGTKIYQALTAPPSRKLEHEWTVESDVSGRHAETSFRVIAANRRGAWIEAIPKTGRTHQIRVHLAEHGLPILGDDLYGTGKPDFPVPRLMLHASRLVFPHPITKREITIASALPADFSEQASERQLLPKDSSY